MPILISLPLKPFPYEDNNIFVVGYETQEGCPGVESNNGILQKFNASGTLLKTLTFSDRIMGVATHINGDYVITSKTNVGTVIIRKYNSSDTLQWSAISTIADGVQCKFDYYGRIYMAYLDTTINQYSYRRYSNGGSTELTVNNVGGGVLSLDKNYNVYIGAQSNLRKYSPSGTLLWELTNPAGELAIISDIRTDKNNNVYFVCDGFPDNDLEVFKYDTDGNFIWSRSHGVELYGIDVDFNNNVYVTGRGVNNIGTRKYNTNGTLLWSINVSTDTNERIKVKAGNDGYIYLSEQEKWTCVINGRIYYRNNNLRKHNSNDGSLVWSQSLNNTYQSGTTDLDIQYKDLQI